MSDETTLLPCPFCGGEAQVQHQSRELYGDAVDWYGVYCKKQFCGYVSGQSTEAEAIAAWNTRTHGTLTAEQVRDAIENHVKFYEGGYYDEQAIADELNAMLCGGRVNEDSIDKWLREFQIAHGELAHIGPDELKDLAFALHDDIPLGYEASMRLGQWLLNAELGSGTCENVAPEYLDFLCSECGFVHYHSDENDSGDGNDWAFCPNCGRKVER